MNQQSLQGISLIALACAAATRRETDSDRAVPVSSGASVDHVLFVRTVSRLPRSMRKVERTDCYFRRGPS